MPERSAHCVIGPKSASANFAATWLPPQAVASADISRIEKRSSGLDMPGLGSYRRQTRKSKADTAPHSVRVCDLLLADGEGPRMESSFSDRQTRPLEIRVRKRANGHGNQIRASFGFPEQG